MFVSVMVPQFETTPLMVCGAPATLVVQCLVTAMQGGEAGSPMHGAVAVFVTVPPHKPFPMAVTRPKLVPHNAVMIVL
jgi:hypothetical protein